jgi:ABC-type glycerol-3-phosphate transport system permease component
VIKRKKNTSRNIFGFIVILVTTGVVLFPIYWMACTSFKNESDIFRLPPEIFPSKFTWENYSTALTRTPIPTFFLNTAINVAGTLVISLICASMAAYAISRFKFRLRLPYLGIILISQMLPLITLIVPLYIILGNLKMFNNRLALIFVYSALLIPISTWLFLGYINTIPREIDEAARIDGCTNLMILFRIVIPLSKPGLMAVGLNTAITVWQELILAMTLTSLDAYRPLMAGVSATITKAGVRWGQMTATGVIACIPILIVYIFCQRYLIRGLTGGAVKG